MKRIHLLVLLLLGSSAIADGLPDVKGVLRQLGISAPIDHLGPAPIAGFLEVVADARVIYVAIDGGIVIDGEILSLGRGLDLTEETRAAVRRDLLATVPEDERIVLRASGRLRHRITVFTDTDCPYCRRFHEQIEDYRQAGIEIQYLFYPRAGRDSPAFARAVAVWCATNRTSMLGTVLAGGEVTAADCANPVADHYDLALRLGLKGTPALIAEDGTVMYGVVTPAELSSRLDGLRNAPR
jgi:thiol:disulfide interchange protein DsbC